MDRKLNNIVNSGRFSWHAIEAYVIITLNVLGCCLHVKPAVSSGGFVPLVLPGMIPGFIINLHRMQSACHQQKSMIEGCVREVLCSMFGENVIQAKLNSGCN